MSAPASAAQPEETLVDVCAPLTSLTFTVMKAAVITGLAWIAVGFLDGPYSPPQVPMAARNFLVLVWAAVMVWQLLLPVARSRHQLFQVTDRRIRVRPAWLKARADSIALSAILDARRRRGGTLALSVMGHERALVFENVPRPKKVAEIIRGLLG